MKPGFINVGDALLIILGSFLVFSGIVGIVGNSSDRLKRLYEYLEVKSSEKYKNVRYVIYSIWIICGLICIFFAYIIVLFMN